MKAIICRKYGPPDVLQLDEVEKPRPKGDEVLIKIHAATVTAGDCEVRTFKFPLLFRLLLRVVLGFTKPRQPILGQELAGEIEAVGRRVKQFKTGDQIFAATGLRFGAYAEYACLAQAGAIAIKPANMSYEEAACVPTGGLNALHFIRKAKLQRGERLLINGACGSIGTFAVQLAKHHGAHVTAVDSAEKLAVLSAIGADAVIDYTREDFTKNGEAYDVIFDIVGKSSFSRSLRSLKPNGRYLLGNPRVVSMLRGSWTSMTSNKKVIFEFAGQAREDLLLLKEFIEAGKLKAVIDKRFPLEETAAAHRYVDQGHKKGNVVITVVRPSWE